MYHLPPRPPRQAIKYHPDKNPDGVEMFQKLQNAYDVLSDEDQRKQYVQLLQLRRAKTISRWGPPSPPPTGLHAPGGRAVRWVGCVGRA